MSETIEIKRGQVWESRHKDDQGRRVVIVKAGPKRLINDFITIQAHPNGRTVRTRRSVFLRGYRLVKEAGL